MSAYVDKSQGITFVYSNIFDLYKKAKDAKLDAPYVAESGRVLKNKEVKVQEFKPKNIEAKEGQRTFTVPMGVREAEEKALAANARPISHIKKNLSELTDAHEKLRFLLQELESLTKKN